MRRSAQAVGGAPAVPPARELASPLLANAVQTSFAGSGNPPQSPPARGRHCDPVGGYMRKEGAEQREGSKEDSIDWLRLPTAAVPASGLLAGTRPTLLVLLAREPIFSETHTNEFCGIGKSTQEPAGSWAPLRPGRWVYEKGEGAEQRRRGEKTVMAGFGSRRLRCPTPLPTLRFSLAREPIFSETHTNEFCGIGRSTQEPAGSWAPLRPGRWVYEGKERKPCGGDVEAPRHLSTAAFAGRCKFHFIIRRSRVVPYGLPGYRRFRRAPPQHRCCPGAQARGRRGIWEDSVQAQGNTPCAPRGGLCGCLADGQTST